MASTFNILKPNGLYHSYHLDKPISNLSFVWYIVFVISFIQIALNILSVNSEHPSQTPHNSVAFYLGLHNLSLCKVYIGYTQAGL